MIKIFCLIMLLILAQGCSNEPPIQVIDIDKWKEQILLTPVIVDGKYGYIDTLGTMIIRPQFDEASIFEESLAVIMVKGKYGYINPLGEIVIKPQFDDAEGFSEGLAKVWMGGEHKWRLLPAYDPNNQNCPIPKFGKCGFIDKKGKHLTNPVFDDADNFSGGLAAVEIRGKWGYINLSGEVAIYYQYYYAGPFSDGWAQVQRNESWYSTEIINKDGQVLQSKYPIWCYLNKINSGLIRVTTAPNILPTHWGYIDTSGKCVVKPKYDFCNDFSEGLGMVKTINNKYGFVNTRGHEVIKAKYESASGFHGGFATVELDGRWGVINRDGQFIIKPQFADCDSMDEDRFIVNINRKWGAIDLNGNYVIEPKYDYLENFKRGLAVAKLGKDMFLINRSGRIVWTYTASD